MAQSKERDMPYLEMMVKEVKSLGMETCMTLGMIDNSQAQRLAEAGLDYYNHNLDTSPEYYGNIITTRSYQDRLNPRRRDQSLLWWDFRLRRKSQ